ncbi:MULTISPECIES: hypothetical protein [Microvirga]|uniref:hypothetical protein n=1 Tax=Microvirga TaxID=186650 RepID=UPI001B3715BF|nr:MULTISPECIES: hypothetical protein [unclassified Microvirga]MBQ0821226.1 hypothetical protein [Microvirga sp. HBU67558]
MKRNTRPFSVEIKKSRIPSHPHHLPPKPLFEPAPVEPAKVFQREEPEAAAKPSPVPRMLLSIIEPIWGSSDPAEPARRKHSAPGGNREQVELDLAMSASEDAKKAHSVVPGGTEVMPQADIATEENAMSGHDVQAMQGESAKASPRRPTRKTSEVVEQIEASQPMGDLEETPDAEFTWPSAVTSPQAVDRRLIKRQAAAIQLPRHERWKRRLHPASW